MIQWLRFFNNISKNIRNNHKSYINKKIISHLLQLMMMVVLRRGGRRLFRAGACTRARPYSCTHCTHTHYGNTRSLSNTPPFLLARAGHGNTGTESMFVLLFYCVQIVLTNRCISCICGYCFMWLKNNLFKLWKIIIKLHHDKNKL